MKALIEKSRQAFANKLFDSALEHAEEILQTEANNPSALQIAAKAATALDKPEKALRYWEECIAEKPENLQGYLGYISAAEKFDRLADGLAISTTALEKCQAKTEIRATRVRLLELMQRQNELLQERADLLANATSAQDYSTILSLARWYQQNNLPVHAVTCAEKALTLKPDAPPAKLLLGRLYFELDQLDRGLKIWLEIFDAKDDSNTYLAAIFLARIFKKQGNHQETERYCRAAVVADSDQLDPYKIMIAVHIQKRDWQSAEHVIAELERQKPDSSAALLLGAQLFEATGALNKALANYQEAYSQWPDDEGVIRNFRRYLGRNEDLKNSVALLQQLSTNQPEIFQHRLDLVNAWYEKKEWYTCLALIQNEILSTEPNNLEMLLVASDCCIQLGLLTDALAYLEDGLREHTSEIRFWESSAKVLRLLERQNECEALLNKATENFTQETDHLLKLARIYIQAENWPQAINLLRDLEAQKPDDVAVHRLAMRAKSGMGDYFSSAQHARRIREQIPEDDDACIALAKAGVLNLLCKGPTENSDSNLNAELRTKGLGTESILNAILNESGINAAEQKNEASGSIVITTLEGQNHLSVSDGNLLLVSHVSLPGVQLDEASHVTLENFQPQKRLAERTSTTLLLSADSNVRRRIQLIEALGYELAELAAPLFIHFTHHRPAEIYSSHDLLNIAVACAGLLSGATKIRLTLNARPPKWPLRYAELIKNGYLILAQSDRIVLQSATQDNAREYARWLGQTNLDIRVIN